MADNQELPPLDPNDRPEGMTVGATGDNKPLYQLGASETGPADDGSGATVANDQVKDGQGSGNGQAAGADKKSGDEEQDPAKDKAEEYDKSDPADGVGACPRGGAGSKLPAAAKKLGKAAAAAKRAPAAARSGGAAPKRSAGRPAPQPASTGKSPPKKADPAKADPKKRGDQSKTGDKKDGAEPAKKPTNRLPIKMDMPNVLDWNSRDGNTLAGQVATSNPNGGISILGPMDTMRGEMAKYKDPDGMFPVATHASPTDFHMYYGAHQIRKEYDVDTMAKLIRENAPPGSSIRLLGCESGMTNGGVAQQLADRLGPDYKLFAPNGYCELKNGVTNVYLKKPSEMPWGVEPPKGEFLEIKPSVKAP